MTLFINIFLIYSYFEGVRALILHLSGIIGSELRVSVLCNSGYLFDYYCIDLFIGITKVKTGTNVGIVYSANLSLVVVEALNLFLLAGSFVP